MSMTVQSAPRYIQGISKNRETGEWEEMVINYTELLENAAAARDAVRQQLASSERSLSKKEMDVLVERLYRKYDPENMSQEEFDRFLDDLIDSGALTRAETEGMGSKVMVDPTAPGGLVQVRPGESLTWSLSEANGNVNMYLNTLLRWYDSGTQADKERSDAIRKVMDILDAILERREQSRLER